MKKSLLLLLVLTLIFSTVCGVTVSADETITRVSLWNNLSYYSSEVPEGTKIVVEAYNASGDVVDLTGKTITYKSESPWIVDVNENGYLVDYGYGYCGSTKITASVDGVDGSFILIKTDGDGAGSFNHTMFIGDGTDLSTDGMDHAFTPAVKNSNYIARRAFNSDADHTSAIAYNGDRDFDQDKDTNTGVYGNLTTGGTDSDYVVSLKYVSTSWDKQGSIRMTQHWFYDDGVSPIDTRMFMCQSSTSTPAQTHGLVSSFQQATGNTSVGYYFYGALGSDETKYTNPRTDNNQKTFNTINRTVGWHQVTTTLSEDGIATVYIDGEVLYTCKLVASDGASNQLYISARAAGKYDDFVICGNPNTEPPAEFKLPAESISLYKNTSYLTSVDEGASLIVTGLDKNGNEGVLPEGTIEYTSSNPWVLDIDDDGTFIDGECDGQTIVTATVGDMSASIIFIKATSYEYNSTEMFNTDYRASVNRVGGIGSGYNWKTYMTAANADVTENTTGGHDGGRYFTKNTTGNNVTDNHVAIRYGRGSWDNEAQIRIAQGWFKDDGVSELEIKLQAAQLDPENNPSSNSADGLASWKSYGLDPDLKAAAGSNGNGFYWYGGIKAAAGESVYTKIDKTTSTQTTVARTKGWHQATMIVGEDGTVNVYIDGQVFMSSALSAGNHDSHFFISGRTAGDYDDFVLAQNLNVTKPVTITVADTVNGTVTYGGEPATTVATHEGVTEVFEITPDPSYVVDKITYGDDNITALYKDGKISVAAKDATLTVTFKKEVKFPSILTARHENDITYITIEKGNTGVVTQAGILFGEKGVTEMLKLIGYSEYTDENNNKPVTSDSFAIKVAKVNGLEKATTFTAQPFVTYTEGGESTDAVYAEAFEQEVYPN